MLRRLAAQRNKKVLCRDQHPHLLVERHEYQADPTGQAGVLKVSGYVRKRPLSVNGLLHFPGVGDFQMSQVSHPFFEECLLTLL